MPMRTEALWFFLLGNTRGRARSGICRVHYTRDRARGSDSQWLMWTHAPAGTAPRRRPAAPISADHASRRLSSVRPPPRPDVRGERPHMSESRSKSRACFCDSFHGIYRSIHYR